MPKYEFSGSTDVHWRDLLGIHAETIIDQAYQDAAKGLHWANTVTGKFSPKRLKQMSSYAITEDAPLPVMPTRQPKPASHTQFVCSRRSNPATPTLQTRKFKAICGTKFTVEITHKRKIKSIETEYPCRHNCESCAKQIETIKKIIEEA